MKLIRLIVGVFVSIGVLLVLDLIPWKIDAGRLSFVQLYFALGVTAAIGVGVASFAGAIVARVNFIGPAVLIACAAWYLADSFVQVIASSTGTVGSSMTILANLTGLALAIGGAIVGAVIGRWFCKQNEDNDSIAA